VLEKIIDSGLKTYFKEVTLLDQVSNHPDHGGKTIAQTLKEHEGKLGAPVAIAGFVRFALGEGVEKPTEDFASEVAAAAKG
jgi:elongation factor Ts